MDIESLLAQQLASNSLKIRNKAIKKLNKWLTTKSYAEDAFDEESMLKVWKGLHYYFWNLDKPLIQEDMASQISKFIYSFKKDDYGILFIKAYFQTLAREWYGIDRYRLEKFMMFCRCFLNESFCWLKQNNWEFSIIKKFRKALHSSVFIASSEDCPLGFKLHITDIFMEELAKVGADTLTPENVKTFLVPFCDILRNSEEKALLSGIQKDVILYLVNQEVDNPEFEEFPILKFDSTALLELLRKHKSKGCLKKYNVKVFDNIIAGFQVFEEGRPEEVVPRRRSKYGPAIRKRAIEKAAESLMAEHEEFSKEKVSRKRVKMNDSDVEDI